MPVPVRPDPSLREAQEARYRALAHPARRRLLRVLEDRGEPSDVETLAAASKLHHNTVRGHLEVLERAGMVERSVEDRSSPGRPRLLYRYAGDDESSPPGGYRLLAEMLATSLRMEAETPAEAAEKAGRVWGRYLMEPVPPGRSLSHAEVVERMTTMMGEFGFEPRPSEEGPAVTVEIGDCPFREMARENKDVVCSLHLGLLRGCADALGGTTEVESLEPFVAPSLCRTVLRPR